jgi:ferredoxin
VFGAGAAVIPDGVTEGVCVGVGVPVCEAVWLGVFEYEDETVAV